MAERMLASPMTAKSGKAQPWGGMSSKASTHHGPPISTTVAPLRSRHTPFSPIIWRKIHKIIKRLRPVFSRSDWAILNDVQITDANAGEFFATGLDPQFQLCYRLGQGWYRAKIKFRLPVTSCEAKFYPNYGEGYLEGEAFTIPVKQNALEERIFYLPQSAKLRFDPMTGPGPLQVEDLFLERICESVAREAMRNRLVTGDFPFRQGCNGDDLKQLWQGYNNTFRYPHSQQSLRSSPHNVEPSRFMSGLTCGTWIKRVWPAYGPGDWNMVADVQAGAGTGEYIATGSDPQFALRYRLQAGWYKFELQLDLPTPFAEVKLFPNFGDGYSEATAFMLPVSSEMVAKRIIYLPKNARLRFDPMSSIGNFKIQHINLRKISEAFAIKRMRKKLAARHKLTCESSDVMQLWRDYNEVFVDSVPVGKLASYSDWIEKVESVSKPTPSIQMAKIASWTCQPQFSIVIITQNSAATDLSSSIESVSTQSYPYWKLCVTADSSTSSEVHELVARYNAKDTRVKLTQCLRNGQCVETLNTSLTIAGEDFIFLLHAGDMLPAHALYAVAEALQERPMAQLIYSDEDRLDDGGRRCDPFFKPDWCPDLLYSQNYLSRLTIYRRSLVESVGGFHDGFHGGEEYDLVLRCAARITDGAAVLHIPQILCHCRRAPSTTNKGNGGQVSEGDAGCRALQRFFDNRSEKLIVSVIAAGLYRQQRLLPESPPLVTLIIPTRDACDILNKCIDSILTHTTYPNYEIIVVDNQTRCSRTLSYLEGIGRHTSVRVLRYDQPFNYSAINNFAAQHAKGDVLGLINNDVEVITPDWLSEMVTHVIRPEIGCVGAKLYYPDDTIQHAGVILGLGGVAGHSHKHVARSSTGYFGRLKIVHNVSAVTGAALLIRKELFQLVGGLDEKELAVTFNDVDLCLKVRDAGFYNIWTPFAELYHHESKTRGTDTTPDKQARFKRECEVMQRRWSNALFKDPCYSPHLTLSREDYSIGMHT
jgi:GT2 family glycosyltransferase